MGRGTSQPVSRLSRGLAVAARVHMARRGMDQATLAADTGMSPAYLSKRLNEQMGFSLFDVERLAEAFGVDPQGLMLEAVREAKLLCDDA